MACFGRESCNEKWCKENCDKKKKLDFDLKRILRCDTLKKTEPWYENECKKNIDKCNMLLSYYNIIEKLQKEILSMNKELFNYELQVESFKESELKKINLFKTQILQKRQLRNKYVQLIKTYFNIELI